MNPTEIPYKSVYFSNLLLQQKHVKFQSIQISEQNVLQTDYNLMR